MRTVRDVIDAQAARQGAAVFLKTPDGDELTFLELQRSCRSFAARLLGHGIGAGDSVAFAMPNGLDTVRVILGSLYAGCLTTAVNLVAGATTISYVLEHSGAKVVFVSEASRHLIEGDAIVATGDWFDGDDDELTPLWPTDDALLMYTSGTTGRPKGVVHTHASLLAGGDNAVLAHELSPEDFGLCVLPLYHINGLCVSLMGALVSGGSLVMPPRFSVSTFWSDARDCTWFSIVPTQVSYLLHDEVDREMPKRLRFGRSASAPLSPEIQEAFEARFKVPIIETMGLTETAAQILSNPMHGLRKIGSPGIPYGNEVIIADPLQMELPCGEEGEICVRGSNVLREYRQNPQATADAITPVGWLRTGDLGRMDEDGFVFVTGRLKELIIKGGENIAPREVDDALYTHPDVIEAGAFARACADYGQRVEAAVKLTEGSTLTSDALVKLCRERIGNFKAPDHVHILSELPKGPSGKIQRLTLAELTSV
ncbi:AMP-binding protein [Ahrensia sp. R2A130]|uniref:AMP-binding protein n=1 Tax=Ahrensia sp. R2A130 TaxID=744979 RepID=UPI0001E0D845|nr:AMP-binding protein [Ahrensia sp. R2A130]EFL89291.1 putative peroxisomal-coenzyme A synthetase [Ahrensia sp. R2A130]